MSVNSNTQPMFTMKEILDICDNVGEETKDYIYAIRDIQNLAKKFIDENSQTYQA